LSSLSSRISSAPRPSSNNWSSTDCVMEGARNRRSDLSQLNSWRVVYAEPQPRRPHPIELRFADHDPPGDGRRVGSGKLPKCRPRPSVLTLKGLPLTTRNQIGTVASASKVAAS
jgi:hypothetical protein